MVVICIRDGTVFGNNDNTLRMSGAPISYPRLQGNPNQSQMSCLQRSARSLLVLLRWDQALSFQGLRQSSRSAAITGHFFSFN